MRLIPGTPLVGFAIAFDGASGDPKTSRPYPVVVPSTIGTQLLPFSCPHCGADCDAPVHPERRFHYFDARRKHSWCPECRGRFFVDRTGTPLLTALEPGAKVAPALVSRKESVGKARSKVGGKGVGDREATYDLRSWTTLVGPVEVGGLDFLGAL